MLRFLNKLLMLVILLGIIGVSSVHGPEVHRRVLRHYVSQKAVKILNDAQTGGGSGFHVVAPSGKTYILTNSHVCEGVKDKQDFVNIVASNDEAKIAHKRKIIATSDKHDLCLIEPLFNDIKGLVIGPAPSKGETVGVVGHPHLLPLTVSLGEYIDNMEIELIVKMIPLDKKQMDDTLKNITDILNGKKPKKKKKKIDYSKLCKAGSRYVELNGMEKFMYNAQGVCVAKYESSLFTSIIRPGNSGSPVIDFYGRLIGVVFAGSSQSPIESFFVPIKYVNDFLSNR